MKRGRAIRAAPFASVGLASIMVWAVSGCSDGPMESAPGFSLDTLESGRVIARNSDRASTPRWRLVERLRLGSDSEDGPELFGEVGGVALGADGEVYVLDSQAAEVRVFGRDGEFLRRFGGGGEGPGELAMPSGLVWGPQGDLWVLNRVNGRYTAYDPQTGGVTREPRRQVAYAQFPWSGGFDEVGRLVDVGLDAAGTSAALRLDQDYVPRDTITLPQLDPADEVVFTREGVTVFSVSQPFAARPSWGLRPQGGIVVGEGRDYRLHRIGFGGDTTLTIELDREREPVTAAESDSAMAVFNELTERVGGATPSQQPSARELKPAHGDLFVDDQDRIWARAVVPGDAVRWDVFSTEGRFIEQVEAGGPTGFQSPSVRDSSVAMIAEVEGIPVVVVYELVEVASPSSAEPGPR